MPSLLLTGKTERHFKISIWLLCYLFFCFNNAIWLGYSGTKWVCSPSHECNWVRKLLNGLLNVCVFTEYFVTQYLGFFTCHFNRKEESYISGSALKWTASSHGPNKGPGSGGGKGVLRFFPKCSSISSIPFCHTVQEKPESVCTLTSPCCFPSSH